MKKLESDSFRIKSSLFFLTYTKYGLERCDTFLGFFEEKFPNLKSLVCVNKSSEDGSMHFHLLVSFEKVIDCRSSNLFDMFVENYGISHPNIQKVYKQDHSYSFDYCSSYEKAWKYCFKDWRIKEKFIDYMTTNSIEGPTIKYLLSQDRKLEVENSENLDWSFEIKGYKESKTKEIISEKVFFSKKEGISLKGVEEEDLYEILKELAEKEGVVNALLFYEKSVPAKIYLSKLVSLKKNLSEHVELMMSKRKMENSETPILALNSFEFRLDNFKLIEQTKNETLKKVKNETFDENFE
jgi:Geminivirus Rep catalytic domain